MFDLLVNAEGGLTTAGYVVYFLNLDQPIKSMKYNIIPTLALSKSGYGSKFPTSSQPVTQAPLVINLYVIF